MRGAEITPPIAQAFFVRVMARQVRPWLMKPGSVRAPVECEKADGRQPAEPISDSGLRATAKVRIYGCNRNPSAASREEPGKLWGRPCTVTERAGSGHRQRYVA